MVGPEIATPRLKLRPHAMEDFEALADLWSRPEVVRWITGKPSTRAESWARLLRYRGHWSLLGFGYFAVFERQRGRFVGDIGLADFQRQITPSLDGTAEAGWVLHPNAWGKGYATEALDAIFAWYGQQTAPRPLSRIIAPQNDASLRLAGKLGFSDPVETTYLEEPTLLFRRR